MRKNSVVDLGVVQIHKKVIGDIAVAALADVPGVQLAHFGIISILAEMVGYRNYPGVTVRVDKDYQISIDIKVIMNYGLSIANVARQVQDAVQLAVEDALDISLREINVNIQAIERKAI